MIIGLAAAPACIIWDLITRQLGNLNALLLAFVIQLSGMLIPILSSGLIWTFISTALFGSTLIGLVSLVLTMAGRYFPNHPAQMMGKITLSCGAAEIATPATAGVLAQWSSSYTLSIIFACGTVFVGCCLIYRLRTLE